MKKVTNKTTIIVTAIVVGVIATASTSFAHRGNWMGHGENSTSTLTVEQQQKLDAVKEKYAAKLDALQSSLNKKSEEYSNALADDSTTVGTLNRLDAERIDLKRQYFALLDQANQEAGISVPGNNGPWFNCDYTECDHQNHMGSQSYGRHMGHNHQNGMHGNHMARCW